MIPPGPRLIACPNALTMERIERPIQPGLTVAEIVAAHLPGLAAHGHGAHVYIADERRSAQDYIPREAWARVRPRVGTIVTIRVVPMGGGGGGGKSPMRTILSLAVIVAAAAVTWGASSFLGAGIVGTQGAAATWAATSLGLTFAGTLAAGAVGAAAGFVGNLVVNAVAPPPTASLPESSIGNFNFGGTLSAPTLSITGIQNRANPYGPVPRIYGKVRLFPSLAAVTYTEIVGSDQYFRALFDLGYGPLQLSEMKIGTIPLAQFEGVETDIRYGDAGDTPIGLYSNTVHEDSYSTRLTYNNPRILVTRAATEEITADVAFNGLVTFGAGSERQSRSVDIKVEYRLQGAGGWTEHATTTITAATEQPYRYSWRIPNLAAGTYEVRFTRLTADNTSTLTRDECAVTAVRSIEYTPPTVPAGHCLVALRIKATNQLTGSIDSFNCVAEAKLPVWNGSSWSAPTVTRNPAWAFCDVLRGAANKRPLADSRIDLAAIKAWADANDALAQDGLPKYQFDAVIDSRTTVLQILNNIAATARAARTMRDSKYSVVVDAAQDTPVQMFTPRNSWGFKGKKTFVEAPHALKCRYIDPDRDWSQNEVIVYDDGYDANSATLFETMEMFGVTRANQAWRDGRHHLAAGKLRPEGYELFADMEHLVCARGDKVLVQHDVPRWGLGAGRVKARTTNGGGDVTALTFDEVFLQEAGTSYVLRGRYADGTIALLNVAAIGTTVESATVTLATATDPADAPAVGDLCAFGELDRETAPMIVKSINRSGDLNARLELVDEAPEIFTADTGDIPEFDTQSTWPGQGVNQTPDKPAIAELLSNEDAMFVTASGFVPAIRVTFEPRSGIQRPSDYVEAQLRRTGSGDDWRPLPAFSGSPQTIWLVPIDEGETYDTRFRYVSAIGRASEWMVPPAHVVVGRSTPPPDVVNFRINGTLVDGVLDDDAPNDFLGFQILYNRGADRNVATARLAHSETSVPFPYDIGHIGTGTVTIFAYALDTAGNRSATPAIINRDLGDGLVVNIIDTLDLAAEGFPGTITGGAVSGGAIEADDDGGLYLADGSALYLPDGTADYLPIAFDPVVYEFTFRPDADAIPSTMTLTLEVEGDGLVIEYKGDDGCLYCADGADPYLGPDADPYLPGMTAFATWPGDVPVGILDYVFRISLSAGSVQGRIDALEVNFDVPDQEEAFDDVVLASGGSRLALTKDWRSIRNVQLTLQSGTADTIKILDKDATLGPLVRAYAAGVGVAATIDARIQGVPR